MSYITSRLRLAAPIAIGSMLLPFIASAQVASTSPLITNVTASTTASSAGISWTTDILASSQVGFGTSSPVGGTYTMSTTQDMTQVTNHFVTLPSLTANTSYHFQVMSQNGTSTDENVVASTTGYSGDMTLLTMPATTTSTSTDGAGTTTPSIDPAIIQNFITQLTNFQSQIGQWISQLLAAIGNSGTGNNGGGTGTTTPSGGAMIEQPSNVRAGTNVDLRGSGFGSEEYVAVSCGGTRVATAFSNIAGGFTTGSIPVGNTTGTFTYTFVGQSTGRTVMVNVTVIP